MVINVLGTEYNIYRKTEEEDRFLEKCDGYCDKTSKKIVVREFKDGEVEFDNLKWYLDKVLRHEIVHAFLIESGLCENASHDDEQTVDWIAIQFPKMLKIFKELDIID